MKRSSINWVAVASAVAGGALIAGSCSRAPRVDEGDAYVKLLGDLLDPSRIARLDTPQAEIITSYDRSGGNNDFNNFLGKEDDNWAVLADIDGPGYVTRFWTTGGANAQQRLRFYFDGERKPRIDATIDELRHGQVPPFGPPLSRYEQSCWYSYVPLTFARHLKITARTENFTHEGWPRLFYQVNYCRLPADAGVAAFPRQWGDREQAALRQFAASLVGVGGAPSATESVDYRCELPADGEGVLIDVAGPAVLRELTCAVDPPGAADAIDLEITWDAAPAASVSAPLPAFFGRIWRSPGYAPAFLSTTGETSVCRLPMPFRASARVRVINRGSLAATVTGQARVQRLAQWEPAYGYLHAAWHREGPDATGRPHPIAAAAGSGKFTGCVLGVASVDPSWWVLEGDETLRIDDEAFPGWHGSGLEDYFNGAWYYKNNLVRELHGLVFKRPFTAIQYRFHVDDARRFAKNFIMSFERGPDHASRAWMESVGYTYLRAPRDAGSDARPVGELDAPPDPFEEPAIMSTLGNYERFGDYTGASRAIGDYLSRHTVPFTDVLRLRQLAYRERTEGIEAVRESYEQFAAASSNAAAVAFARLLLWFHEDPSHALLSAFCGNPTRVYLDDKIVGEAGDPRAFTVFPVTLTPGRHVLALQAYRARYPEWVQACLRMHGQMVMTEPNWQFALDPTGNWRAAGFDDSTWATAGDSIREGPPPAPHVITSPHPFVDMQGLPWGIWISTNWTDTGRTAVFRKEFDVP